MNTDAPTRFTGAFAELPLIAILRGVEPAECEAIAVELLETGFRIIEVPLNSPDPYASIRKLSERFGERALVGAGTVLTPEQVDQVHEVGGQLIIAPNFSPAVVERAATHGLASAPGIATPSEAFAALEQGATALKVFPAEGIPPKVIKAWRAVLPPATALIPVGGIGPGSMAAYVANGANGFGIGSALYQPGIDAATVRQRADAFVNAWRALGT